MKYTNRFWMIPSFYGAVAWCLSIFLFEVRIFAFQQLSVVALVLIIFTIATFTFATIIFIPLFFRYGGLPVAKYVPSLKYIIVLHFIGFIGLILAVIPVVTAVGGWNVYFYLLVNNSAVIRQFYTSVVGSYSAGIQISYFGWIAIWLSVIRMRYIKERKIKWLVLLLVSCQFLANIFMIDRTRPFWIIFVSIWLILYAYPKVKRLRFLVMNAVVAVVILLSIFIFVANWTGKTIKNNPGLATVSNNSLTMPYVYATAGIAYFNQITKYETINYSLERSMYPLYMLLSKLKLVNRPPSQINEFYNAPFPTNVGTFLEPYYRDGGPLLCILAIFIHAFGFNLLALYGLKSNQPMIAVLTGNLCFIDVMSSFTPKANSTAIWLICGLTLLTILSHKIIFTQSKLDYRRFVHR